MGRGSGARLSWDGYAAGWAALHLGVDPRRSSVWVRGWLRLSYVVGRALARAGVRPGAVTLIGVLLAAAVPAVVVPRGWYLFVAAGLVLLSAIADSADGAVAVISSRTTRVGAFDDSMADRLSEAAWLLALWLVGAHGLLVVGCGALAWLHEYARARAAASGLSGSVGVITKAERPTRVIAVIAALVLGGVGWFVNPGLTPGAVTVVLALWALLGVLGLIRLTSSLRGALKT
jgi:CDP-diacylglycerol--glycerol-3-phosphate 3-phosphatidyltransferase